MGDTSVYHHDVAVGSKTRVLLGAFTMADRGVQRPPAAFIFTLHMPGLQNFEHCYFKTVDVGRSIDIAQAHAARIRMQPHCSVVASFD